jgi:hypothetical protein
MLAKVKIPPHPTRFTLLSRRSTSNYLSHSSPDVVTILPIALQKLSLPQLSKVVNIPS